MGVARDRETDEAIRGEGPIRKSHGSGHRADEPKVNKLVTSARDLRLFCRMCHKEKFWT